MPSVQAEQIFSVSILSGVIVGLLVLAVERVLLELGLAIYKDGLPCFSHKEKLLAVVYMLASSGMVGVVWAFVVYLVFNI